MVEVLFKMTEEKIDDILKRIEDDIIEVKISKNIIYLKIDKKEYLNNAKYFKEHGFRRLLTVSAVDWLEENQFEVYFILHNIKNNFYIKVSTIISRKEAEIESLCNVWPNAELHERETWEMFNITFKGNKMLYPFFLENWVGPPPFRKDFDWREYVKDNYNLTVDYDWRKTK